MTTSQDAADEALIQAKGATTAPRLSPSDIDATIASKFFFTAGDGVRGESQMGTSPAGKAKALDLLTICVLVLQNGFTVTGTSACASPENFDAEIGREIAYSNAREEVWRLEGYLLKDRLFQATQTISG